jgi:hypothetical protein
MSSSDPVDAVQKYIETNKDALSQISFGGGKKVIKCEIFVASLSRQEIHVAGATCWSS